MKSLSALALGTACSISLSAIAAVQPASAQLVNGGFETGNFTGWATTGNASIQTSAFGSGPTEGTFEALLSTGDPTVPDFSLEAFLGLAPEAWIILAMETLPTALLFDKRSWRRQETF
jgi:hypothetical protein